MKRVKKDLDFVGYTYKADVEEEKQQFVSALQELNNEATGYEGGEPLETQESTESKSSGKSHMYYENESKNYNSSKYHNQNYGSKNTKEYSNKMMADENTYDSKKYSAKGTKQYTNKNHV